MLARTAIREEIDEESSAYERRHLNLTSREALTRTRDRLAILRHLCVNAGDSQHDMVEALRIPKSSIESRLRELAFEGWVHFRRELQPTFGKGRPPRRFFVTPERLILLGAEAGVGHVTVVATTLIGELVAREVVTSDSGDALECLTRTLLRMHARVHASDRKVLGVGIALGADALAALRIGDGSSPEGMPNELLHGTSLGRVPVHLQLDVCAAALGEMEFGAGTSTTPLLFLKIHNGVNACLVKRDDSFNGDWNLSAEVSQTCIQCPCAHPRCTDSCGAERAINGQAADIATLPGCANAVGQSLAAILAESGLTGCPMRIAIAMPEGPDPPPNVEAAVQSATRFLSSVAATADVSQPQFGASAAAMGAAALVRHRMARPDGSQLIPDRPQRSRTSRREAPSSAPRLSDCDNSKRGKCAPSI